MNFRDYDRKFWLVVETENKKIKDLHLPIDNNAFLCYSYYTPNGKYYIKESLIFEALFEAIYNNGEYAITQNNLLIAYTVNLFTKAQLEGFNFIPIDINAINLNLQFDHYIESINKEYYGDKTIKSWILKQ